MTTPGRDLPDQARAGIADQLAERLHTLAAETFRLRAAQHAARRRAAAEDHRAAALATQADQRAADVTATAGHIEMLGRPRPDIPPLDPADLPLPTIDADLGVKGGTGP